MKYSEGANVLPVFGSRFRQLSFFLGFLFLFLFEGICYAADAAGSSDITFQMVIRKYMYVCLAVAGAAIVLMITTSYMVSLNKAMRGEIKNRKQIEKALRESVQRFQYIVTCSGDWIWETDIDGCYTFTSEIVKDMLGYEPESVLGKYQHEFFTAGEKEGFMPIAKEFYASRKKIFRKRLRLVTSEGRVVIHQSTAEPMWDKNGEMLGYRGVNRDVTKEVRFVKL